MVTDGKGNVWSVLDVEPFRVPVVWSVLTVALTTVDMVPLRIDE